MGDQDVKRNFEFVALMAAMMSIAALAIDAILPAISQIGISINSIDQTQNQLLITMIFLGLGVGQLFFGPLSDSFGRKPIVYGSNHVFCNWCFYFDTHSCSSHWEMDNGCFQLEGNILFAAFFCTYRWNLVLDTPSRNT